MILFQNCTVYSPDYLGKKDVFIGGGKILAVGEKIPKPRGMPVEVVSGEGLLMTPGFVDAHVHFAGAGGEGGPATRTPELHLSMLTRAGVTTAVGCLGTDGVTRTAESLLMKAKGLRQEGLSSWIYSGSYQVPPPTAKSHWPITALLRRPSSSW